MYFIQSVGSSALSELCRAAMDFLRVLAESAQQFTSSVGTSPPATAIFEPPFLKSILILKGYLLPPYPESVKIDEIDSMNYPVSRAACSPACWQKSSASHLFAEGVFACDCSEVLAPALVGIWNMSRISRMTKERPQSDSCNGIRQ